MFNIPNQPDAAFPDQAKLFSSAVTDLVKGSAGAGVVSGCGVTHTTGMNITVASGEATEDGVTSYSISAAGPFTISDQVGTSRIDVVQLVPNTDSVTVIEGTPSTIPAEPDLTDPNGVKLAAIYVPAGTNGASPISSSHINDRRILITLAPNTLDELTDVDTTGASDNEVLTYQAGTWVPAAGGGGGVGSPEVIVAASDAPADWISAATYVCNGTNDTTQINSAITAVKAQLGAVSQSTAFGGSVILSPGNFNINNTSIQLKLSVNLIGSGKRATVLKASGAWTVGNETDGLIELVDSGSDMASIQNLSLYATNGTAASGIYTYTSGNQSGNLAGSPDTNVLIHNVDVFGFDGHGVYINEHPTDFRTREFVLDRVRVFACGDTPNRYGFYIKGTDHWISNCGVGTQGAGSANSGNHGFYARTSDSLFVNCRAWLCRGHGFYIAGSQAQFVGCNSHDNYGSGFYMNINRTTISGSFANNNGVDSGYGFYLGGDNNTVAGCFAMDRVTSEHPVKTQLYGYYLPSTVHGCHVSATAGINEGGDVFNNVTGDVYIPGSLAADNMVIVVGNNGVTTHGIAAGGSSNLDGLTDVVITTPATSETLTYDGANWVNTPAQNAILLEQADPNPVAGDYPVGTLVFKKKS